MKNIICFLLLIIGLISCRESDSTEIVEEENKRPKHEFENDGRDTTGQKFEITYELRAIDTIKVDRENEDLAYALTQNLRYLNRKKRKTYAIDSSLKVTGYQLIKNMKTLQKWSKDTLPLSDMFEAHQICGDDMFGNVHITGYFIPIIKVNYKKDSIYKYPIYRKPSSRRGKQLPSRKEIDEDKVLANKGLELAWSNSLIDNFFMQVQGSGVVEYPDGKRELFSYGGQNGHEYKSIGRYLVNNDHVAPDKISMETIKEWIAENPDSLSQVLNHNASYVFFNRSNKKPTGAAGVPLTALTSVAVDRSFIPLGSCLLAEVPVLDSMENLVSHEYRLLVAQDVGGAIKGSGRMDFFCGTGEVGQKRANALKHYGRVWLLMAK